MFLEFCLEHSLTNTAQCRAWANRYHTWAGRRQRGHSGRYSMSLSYVWWWENHCITYHTNHICHITSLKNGFVNCFKYQYSKIKSSNWFHWQKLWAQSLHVMEPFSHKIWRRDNYLPFHMQIHVLWNRMQYHHIDLGSALAQLISWCLKAPSHYLKQCPQNISELLWHSH